MAQLPGDAQQFEAVFVANADGERDGDYAAGERRPVTIDERLIVVQENDQVIATRHAEAEQSPEDAERALIQLRIGNAALDGFGFEVADVPVRLAIGTQELH